MVMKPIKILLYVAFVDSQVHNIQISQSRGTIFQYLAHIRLFYIGRSQV